MAVPTERIPGVPCELVDAGRHDVGVALDEGRVVFTNKCGPQECDAGERLGIKTCGRLLHDILDALTVRGGRLVLRGEVFDDLEEMRVTAIRIADTSLPPYRRPVWARRKVIRTLLVEYLTLALDCPVTIEPKTIRITGDLAPSLYMLMPDTSDRWRVSWVLASGPGDERLTQNESLRRYTLLLRKGSVLAEPVDSGRRSI